jgi:polyisoprenoid-binding protein YceI
MIMQWTLDPTHAEVEFAVKHLMISTVKGRFRNFTGVGTTRADGTLGAVTMTIDATSLDTNVGQRDDHLRSADFFDVGNHPQLTFASTGIKQHGSDVTITGDLTMRGVTRPVTLTGEYTSPSKDPWGNPRAALAVTGVVNRKEWGLNWNMALEAGGVVVGEDVKLRIEVEATAAQTAGVNEVATAGV